MLARFNFLKPRSILTREDSDNFLSIKIAPRSLWPGAFFLLIPHVTAGFYCVLNTGLTQTGNHPVNSVQFFPPVDVAFEKIRPLMWKTPKRTIFPGGLCFDRKSVV